MKDSKHPGCDCSKDEKYPKPWTQETHDQFIKEMGLTQKEHDEWHQKHEKPE